MHIISKHGMLNMIRVVSYLSTYKGKKNVSHYCNTSYLRYQNDTKLFAIKTVKPLSRQGCCHSSYI